MSARLAGQTHTYVLCTHTKGQLWCVVMIISSLRHAIYDFPPSKLNSDGIPDLQVTSFCVLAPAAHTRSPRCVMVNHRHASNASCTVLLFEDAAFVCSVAGLELSHTNTLKSRVQIDKMDGRHRWGLAC